MDLLAQTPAQPPVSSVTEAEAFRASPQIIPLPPGVYLVRASLAPGFGRQVNGVQLPFAQVTSLPVAGAKPLRFESGTASSESLWLPMAQPVITFVNADSAPLLLSTFTLGNDAVSGLSVEIRRVDEVAAPPQPLSVKLKVHLQWIGDREFLADEWASGGDRLAWIEGLTALMTPDTAAGLEYCAISAVTQDNDWKQAGDYAGSRGRGAPLLGLRFRLTGALAATHSVTYACRFLRQGEVEGSDGSLCRSTMNQDPVIAVKINLIKR